MKFLTEKTRDSMLFPRPIDGTVVKISPPGLAWLFPAIRSVSTWICWSKKAGSAHARQERSEPLRDGCSFTPTPQARKDTANPLVQGEPSSAACPQTASGLWLSILLLGVL